LSNRPRTATRPPSPALFPAPKPPPPPPSPPPSRSTSPATTNPRRPFAGAPNSTAKRDGRPPRPAGGNMHGTRPEHRDQQQRQPQPAPEPAAQHAKSPPRRVTARSTAAPLPRQPAHQNVRGKRENRPHRNVKTTGCAARDSNPKPAD